MDTTPRRNTEDQEIDLSQISRKINQGFSNIGAFIFNCIQFVLKNAIILVLLTALGLALGFYMDTKVKKYEHSIIVIPNFGSSDYLYSKIELINSKIKQGDTAYLKSIGFRYPKNISKLKIEPIIDPYNFIANSEANFELLKLMSEDGSIDKVLLSEVTSKNYSYHLITFSTKGIATRENVYDPLIKALNDNDYFKTIQQNIQQNITIKMEANDRTLAQIDGILDKASRAADQQSKSSSLVYINEDIQLDEILKTKDEIIREQGIRRIELVNYQKIVKDISVMSNIEKPSQSKLIFPLLFLLIFVLVKIFINFYRNQSFKQKADLPIQ